jgi:hypothetical protein
MPQSATILPLTPITSTIQPATVTGHADPDGYIRVCRQSESMNRHARMAIYPQPTLAPGDEVLTMTDGSGKTYIVGVLSCSNQKQESETAIHLADGAVARLDRTPTHESLKLYSMKNELLIDYQSQTGTVRVNAASGNLEFSAANGSIAFHSDKAIHIDGNHVAVNARTDLHLGVQDSHGAAGPTISMQNRKMHMSAAVFDLTAQTAQLFLQETRIAGKKLLGRIGNVQFISRRIESVADTVLARAKNVYRTISQLSQLKAGRQRTLIEKTSHMKAQKTIMKSETDFKVKAEKIHLG